MRILNGMQEKGLDLEFVEQPVKAHDFEGLKYVTERSYVPVLADESVFSPQDALTIMQMGAADLVNIKLMKCGGLYNALKIASAAEVYGVECMIGCMLEAKISVNAAVHLACAKQIITRVDLDGPVLCSEDPSSAVPCSTKRRSRFPTSRALASRALSRARSSIWIDPLSFTSFSSSPERGSFLNLYSQHKESSPFRGSWHSASCD